MPPRKGRPPHDSLKRRVVVSRCRGCPLRQATFARAWCRHPAGPGKIPLHGSSGDCPLLEAPFTIMLEPAIVAGGALEETNDGET